MNWAMATLTVNDLLEGVWVDLESLDRVYLNGYVPNLQVGGQVVSFMTQHLGFRSRTGDHGEDRTSFRRAVRSFAARTKCRSWRSAARSQAGGDCVLTCSGRPRPPIRCRSVGVAQEYQNVFAAYQREDGAARTSGVCLVRQGRPRGDVLLLLLWDADFGPAFIKVCAYFPYRSRSAQRPRVAPSGKPPDWYRVHRAVQLFATAKTRPRCRLSVTARPRHHRGVLRPWRASCRCRSPRRTGRPGYWWSCRCADRDLPHHVFDAPPPRPQVLRSLGR